MISLLKQKGIELYLLLKIRFRFCPHCQKEVGGSNEEN